MIENKTLRKLTCMGTTLLKVQPVPQNSVSLPTGMPSLPIIYRHERGDMKQVQHLEPQNIMRHIKKFSGPGEHIPRICASPFIYIYI